MKVVGIVGLKNSGKTHLIERLIEYFARQRLSVSTIKHTHHLGVDVDTPGTDSYRHAAAGATEVVVAADHGWTLLRRGEPSATLRQLLAELQPVDWVLVEGYKQVRELPRIEVRYRRTDAPLLATSDPTIAAVACPPAVAKDLTGRPWLELDDTAAIAAFLAQLPGNAQDVHPIRA